MGSFSTIEKYASAPDPMSSRMSRLYISSTLSNTPETATSYELYGRGEFSFGRAFHNRRFDLAMLYFLECLRQLGEFAERCDPKFKLPYSIDKDKIGQVSVRLSYTQMDVWTKALRCLLTNCKWLLAFTSNHGRAQEQGE
jgi:beclin 1